MDRFIYIYKTMAALLHYNIKMAPSLSSFKKLYLEEQFSTLWPEELNV